jgi:hypothetical protein
VDGAFTEIGLMIGGTHPKEATSLLEVEMLLPGLVNE